MASQSWSQIGPQLIRNVFNKAWQMMPEPEVVVVEADELQDADFGSDSQIAQAQDDELLDQDVLDIENGEPTEEPEETDIDKLCDTHIQYLLDAAAAKEEQLQDPPQGSGVPAAGPTLLDANQMLQMLRQIQETLMHNDLDYTVVEDVIAQVDKIPLRQTTLLQMWKASVKQ